MLVGAIRLKNALDCRYTNRRACNCGKNSDHGSKFELILAVLSVERFWGDWWSLAQSGHRARARRTLAGSRSKHKEENMVRGFIVLAAVGAAIMLGGCGKKDG